MIKTKSLKIKSWIKREDTKILKNKRVRLDKDNYSEDNANEKI